MCVVSLMKVALKSLVRPLSFRLPGMKSLEYLALDVMQRHQFRTDYLNYISRFPRLQGFHVAVWCETRQQDHRSWLPAKFDQHIPEFRLVEMSFGRPVLLTSWNSNADKINDDDDREDANDDDDEEEEDQDDDDDKKDKDDDDDEEDEDEDDDDDKKCKSNNDKENNVKTTPVFSDREDETVPIPFLLQSLDLQPAPFPYSSVRQGRSYQPYFDNNWTNLSFVRKL